MPSINTWGSDEPVEVAKGGTGAPSFGDGYVLLGSGTGAITALDVTAKGSLLVGDGTTDPSVLAGGTDDYVLTADSTQASGLKWAAAPGGGGNAVLLSSAVASSSTTLDFTTSIDSTYNMYLFYLENLVVSVDSEILYNRTSADSGSNWDSGASDYSYYQGYGHGAFQVNAANTVELRSNLGNNAAAYEKWNGLLYLYDPSATTETSWTAFGQGSNQSSTLGMNWIAARRRSAAAVNGFRFYPASGNFVSGTIYMYGLIQPT